MNRKKIVNFCDQAISYLIIGLIFLLPLYFSTLTFLTFEVNKVVFFRVVVEILFLLYVVKMIAEERLNIVKAPLLYWSIGLIFLSQLVATIFSEYQAIAWWGSYLRSDGLFTQMHFYFFAWLFLQAYGQKLLTLNRLLYTITASATVVSVYGILQVSGIDFLKWQNLTSDYLARANSSLGQPNYLASYLLLTVPIVFYLFSTDNKLKLRVLWLLALLIELWALVLTYSRAAWIGLVAVIAIGGLIKLFKKNRLMFKLASVIVLIFVSAFLYISFVKPISIPPDNSSLTLSYRFKTLLNSYQGSNILRLYYFDAAKQIIKQAPVFGHGLDTQALYFYKYYRPDYALYEAIYAFPDRAHNQLLDILITTGVMGLLAWIFIFGAIIKQAMRFYKSTAPYQERLMINSLLAGLLACWVSLMFGFFNVTVLVYFWLMVAWFFQLTNEAPQYLSLPLKLRSTLAAILGLTIIIFVGFVSWQANIKLVLADYYFRQAKIDQLRLNNNQMLTDFNQVLKYAPTSALNSYYQSQIVNESLPALQQLADPANRKNLLDFLADIALRNNSQNYGLYSQLYKNILLSEIGRNRLDLGEADSTIAEFKQAENGFEKLAHDAPSFAIVYFHWGNLYFNQANYAKAGEKYGEALKLYPDLKSPDLNLEHYNLIVADKVVVLRMLAETQIARRNFQAALDSNQQARRLLPTDKNLNKQAARIYFFLGQPDKSEAIFVHQIALKPADDDGYYQLAQLDRALGKIIAAEKSINQAIKLKNLLVYQEFLANLKNQKINQRDYLNIGFTK